MQKIIDNIKINYIDYGEGYPIVLLHGWGQNIEMMNFLGKKLPNHRIIILDFPGFGQSSEPTQPFSVGDYTELLRKFLMELNVDNPILIGHSFGGRVAIKYSSKYDVEKLVLFGAPCIRKEHVPTFKEKLYKATKNTIFGDIVRKYVGSADYNNASPIMRTTLVKVVNEDLLEDAKKISAPTLLMWGNNDTAAPIELAKELEPQMQNAALIELQGTHYAYIENLDTVAIILNNFFSEEKDKPKAR